MMIAVIIFRPIIIVVLLVISVVFIFQNQQPVALVFFGTKTLELSLAVWVLIFTGAGVFTSLFLQLLFRSSGRTTVSQGQANMPTPNSPVSPPPRAGRVNEVFEQPREQPSDFKSFRDSNPSASSSQQWERENYDNEWDIETPPAQPTSIKEEAKEFEPNVPYPRQTSSFEVQQQPKTATRQGSVYSYSYRDEKRSEGRPSEQVYDANYRLITPPPTDTPPETKEDDEDEDWV